MADGSCISLFMFSLLFASFLLVINCSENYEKSRVNVIILGATGDLAKKYLWKGFFNLYLSVQESQQRATFHFYSAARMDNEKGSKALDGILKTSIKCSVDVCEKRKNDFLKISTYLKLKVEKDYEELQNVMEASLEENEVEIGRLFYFSVPPFAYEDISRHIYSKCYPKQGNTWLRIVLEKPFGSDLKTAQDLAEKLSKYWAEDQVYRIDHYLGKTGVRQITEFRKKNQQTYEKIWNRDFIEQISIAVKEKEDAEGRLGFYDHYGVIRDVFQNHLTEILVLVTSKLPEGSTELPMSDSKKFELLKSLRPVTVQDAIFGQYRHYNTQLQKEIPGRKTKSNTPTFSAVLMHIDNNEWFGIPFVLMSGKSLDTRHAYVHIQFKRNAFCVGDDVRNGHCKPKDITFHIQGGVFKNPVTVVSKSLPKFSLPDGWENITLNLSDSLVSPDEHIMKPPPSYDAYSTLIQDIFYGNQNMFIGINDLLHSWKIWERLLEMSAVISPRLYTSDKISELDFEIVKGKIKFITEKTSSECKALPSGYHNENQYGQQYGFRGNRLVSGTALDVVQKLANDIKLAAQMKVDSGGKFHLALSGGSTPRQLFQILVYSMAVFPWEYTHVWVIDERCVSLTHEESNFRTIYEFLLKDVGIPFVNIHPMPVDIAGRLCHKEDGTAELYEELLKYHMDGDILFDFIVLGVGTDGHTASLFPYQNSLKSSRWIELTTIHGGFSRMTLTLPAVNSSKKVAVLILGENKNEIVRTLLEGIVDIDRLPITGVKPLNGSLCWYIDDNALK